MIILILKTSSMRFPRAILLFTCLFTLIPRSRAQETDSVLPSDSLFPAHTLVADPNVKSPFKSIILLHPVANGHKNTATVDIAFTVGNQNPSTAALLFSTSFSVSKAADDLDSIYPISQIRFGTTKKDPSDPDMPMVVELRPDQTLHCGIYIAGVPLQAKYIAKLVLLTSLTVNQASVGEDNIIFTNIPIVWR